MIRISKNKFSDSILVVVAMQVIGCPPVRLTR